MFKSAALTVAETNLTRARGEKFAKQKHLLWVYPPYWCIDGEDESYTFFEEYRFLLEHGEVVWGTVVQANQYLWKPADVMAGATVIYSRQAIEDAGLLKLRETAKRLFALRSAPQAQDPQERAYQAMLIDEMDRAFGMVVPPTLSDGLDAINTTVLIPRTHLEGQMLGLSYFPLLVHPEKRSAVVVPSLFWEDDFKTQWRAGVRPPTESERDELFAPRGRWAKLRIGLGSALHLKNIFWLFTGLMAIVLSLPHFLYQCSGEPEAVTSLDVLRLLPPDTYVECSAPLLTRNKLKERDGKKDFWLIPFSGTGHSMFVVRRQSKHDDSKYDPAQPDFETVHGRLIRGPDDIDWRPWFRNFSVMSTYRSRGITVPPDYVLIDESAQPSLVGALLPGGFILLMSIFPLGAIVRVYRAHRLLKFDDRELLAKLWWQWKNRDEDEEDSYDE